MANRCACGQIAGCGHVCIGRCGCVKVGFANILGGARGAQCTLARKFAGCGTVGVFTGCSFSVNGRRVDIVNKFGRRRGRTRSR